MAMKGSAPASIILDAGESGDRLQDTENSEIGGENGNEPNVSEEATVDGSKEALQDPNNKAKDEFWLGFVVTFLIGGFVFAVFDFLKETIGGGESWVEDRTVEILLLIVPAMILSSFIIGHKRFALGSLAMITLLMVWLFISNIMWIF